MLGKGCRGCRSDELVNESVNRLLDKFSSASAQATRLGSSSREYSIWSASSLCTVDEYKCEEQSSLSWYRYRRFNVLIDANLIRRVILFLQNFYPPVLVSVGCSYSLHPLLTQVVDVAPVGEKGLN